MKIKKNWLIKLNLKTKKIVLRHITQKPNKYFFASTRANFFRRKNLSNVKLDLPLFKREKKHFTYLPYSKKNEENHDNERFLKYSYI